MPSDFLAVEFICLILVLRRIHISSSIGCRRLDKPDRKQSNVTYVERRKMSLDNVRRQRDARCAPHPGSRPVLTSSRDHYQRQTSGSVASEASASCQRTGYWAVSVVLVTDIDSRPRLRPIENATARLSSDRQPRPRHSDRRARPTSARPTRRCSGDGSSHPPANARTLIHRWFR